MKKIPIFRKCHPNVRVSTAMDVILVSAPAPPGRLRSFGIRRYGLEDKTGDTTAVDGKWMPQWTQNGDATWSKCMNMDIYIWDRM